MPNCYFVYKAVKGELKIGKAKWMTCNFTSFSTVFQSYQEAESMIMKSCMQLNPVYG